MIGMDVFFADAEHLFEVARAAAVESPADTAVLLHRDGSIRISSASGWATAAMLAASGATAVYRITRDTDGVRVEGKSNLRSCVLEARQPSAALHTSATAVLDRLRECSLRELAMREWRETGKPGSHLNGNRGSGILSCLPMA